MDVIVSINVFRSISTLEHQIKNIKQHLNAKYAVILNCNQYMYDEILSKMTLDDNIYLNPHILEKKRFHGSLTQGIVSNMNYAVKNFDFKYFVVISGRTIFYRPITVQKFDGYFEKKKWSSLEEMEEHVRGPFPNSDWKWESFKNTKLAKYYMDRNYKLFTEVHEGVCFSYNVTINILQFLENNIEITKDLFDYNDCVEEFSLNTISTNECNIENLEYGFVYIGNGSSEECNYNDLDRYTRKMQFFD
jgi:hypothetical protein